MCFPVVCLSLALARAPGPQSHSAGIRSDGQDSFFFGARILVNSRLLQLMRPWGLWLVEQGRLRVESRRPSEEAA
jgi:hypothetical protein